ncbi:hypothetical protein NDU88_005948 [Pleurodeles waltl]|uniref:Uncharacterized protein n=1 Tax=Pleurodeles waltl TaxID=8319 RepID=A0AAV7TX04_PLEWA|nr:hypothetical protein NDU88_005948 [Pleurodeles waltl]
MQPARPVPGEGLEAHTAAILAAMGAPKPALENKIDTVAVDLGLLRADHCKLTDRVGEIKKERETFKAVKQQPRTLGLKYAFLFTAKLQLVDRDQTHFFTSAREA